MKVKAEVAALKEEGQRASISGDIWGENGIAMLAILLHWVSPDFKMQTRLAACVPFGDVSHTAENITKYTVESCPPLALRTLRLS